MDNLEFYIGIILIVWIILNAYLCFFGYLHVYHRYFKDDMPKDFGADMQQIFLPSTNVRGRINIWYKKPKAGKPTIIYFHGRSESLGWRSFRYMQYIKKGYGVIAPSYYYNGIKHRRPYEKTVIADAKLILDWVHNELNIQYNNTVLYGESFGCAVATQMSVKNNKYKGLVLEVPFYNLYKMFKQGVYYIPLIKLFLPDRYETDKHIKNVKMPILIGGAGADMTTPFEHSEILYNNAPSPKKHMEFAGVRHMGLYDENTWVDAVCDFAKNGLGKIKKKKQIIK